jgi:hypothetical protein
MCASVSDTVEACGPIVGGGVVDRVHPDRIPAYAGAQLVDERLPDGAGPGWLAGTTREHHLRSGA